MASVGSVTLTFLKGVVHNSAETVERLQRSGVDGFGARKGPQRAPRSRLRGVHWTTSLANANTLIDDALALQATLVTVTDEYASTYDDCLIERVRVQGKPQAVYREDGNLKYRVALLFELTMQTE